MIAIAIIISLIAAYLISSISGSTLVIHYSQLPDLTTQGLKTLSAENVLHITNKEKALISILLDALKGFIAIFLASILGVHGFMLGIVLLVVLIGHMFPVYYKFNGGFGIAPVLGGLLIMSFWAALLLIIIWFAICIATRYIYLATLAVAALMPIVMLLFAHFAYFIPTLLIAVLVIMRNLDHLQRLRAGTESRANW